MRRFVLMLTVAAIMTAMMAASAMPAMAKGVTCYAADPDEFYALTGVKTQWGGMVCTRS